MLIPQPPANGSSRLAQGADAGASRTVAWLVCGFEGYGIRQCILTLTGALQKRGWSIPILSLDVGETADALEDTGLTVLRLGAGRPPQFGGSLLSKPLQLIQSVSYARRAAPLIDGPLRRLSAEALHVVLPNLVSLAGRAASRARIPCLWEMPNTISSRYPFELNRRLYQWTCHRFSISPLANSRYTADTLGHGLVEPVVFHLGVDCERFNPAVVQVVRKSELGIPADAITLGMLARITPAKGQDRVLQALGLLKDLQPPLHLVLIGAPEPGSSHADSLCRISRELGVEDRLHLAGQQSAPERFYGAIDIAVSFNIDPEGFGLSVVEAMAMGRPALVHALGGPAETVVDGVTGWHVSDPSVESLAAAIRRALDDRPRWRQMGEAARLRAVRSFSAEDQARRYVAIVEDRLKFDAATRP